MASISQGLVLTTAMVVSSTVLYLGFLRQKTFLGISNSQEPRKQALRSCLYSEEKKREKKKKKKKVQFADNVKGGSETRKEPRKEQRKQNRVSSSCRNEIPEIRGMPKNRIALYHGILRDRLNRLDFTLADHHRLLDSS